MSEQDNNNINNEVNSVPTPSEVPTVQEAAPAAPEAPAAEQEEFEVGSLIVLYDEAGDSVEFDLLDSIEMEDKKYVVLTPHMPEEEEVPPESDVYVMRVVEAESGDNVLEMVDNEPELDMVFQEFKKRTGDEYEFLD